jgi:phosphoribosylformylglycinamidine synthase
VSDGGLAAAIAESCFASGDLSAQVLLQGREPTEWTLFGERGARVVVSVSSEQLARVEAIARQYGVAARAIGRVTRGLFRIQFNGRPVVNAAVASLRDAWSSTLERTLGEKKVV